MYVAADDGLMLMLNITDGANRLLAGHGANMPAARFAQEVQ